MLFGIIWIISLVISLCYFIDAIIELNKSTTITEHLIWLWGRFIFMILWAVILTYIVKFIWTDFIPNIGRKCKSK